MKLIKIARCGIPALQHAQTCCVIYLWPTGQSFENKFVHKWHGTKIVFFFIMDSLLTMNRLKQTLLISPYPRFIKFLVKLVRFEQKLKVFFILQIYKWNWEFIWKSLWCFFHVNSEIIFLKTFSSCDFIRKKYEIRATLYWYLLSWFVQKNETKFSKPLYIIREFSNFVISLKPLRNQQT